MKYLVTGATGFIGHALAGTLIERNKHVYGLARRAEQAELLQRDGIDCRIGDVRDKDSLRSAFKDTDVVVHTAGLVSDWGRPEEFVQVNFHGTRNVLEVCSELNIRRVIHISTADIFGYDVDYAVNEDAPIRKSSCWYTRSKIMAEELVRQYARDRVLELTIIYPTWVYGKGDRHFVPEIIRGVRSRQMLFFGKRGRVFFGLSYIENLCHAICFLMDHPGSIGERFLVSDEPQMMFYEFVNMLAKKVGCKEVRLSLPYWLAYAVACMMELGYIAVRKDERPLLTRYAVTWFGHSIRYDTTKLKATGFKQAYCIEEAIEKTLEHLSREGL
jgi:nucleoside-diphosphate-sugar epimerase